MQLKRNNFSMALKEMERYTHTPSIVAISTYLYIQICGHFKCAAGYYTRRQCLNGFLLVYTLSGKGYLTYKNKSYLLTKGMVFIINCNNFHHYSTDNTDLWEFKYIHFNGIGSEANFNNLYDNHGPVFDMVDDISIDTYISEIIKYKKTEDMRFEIKTAALIPQIITALLLTASDNPSKSSRSTHSIQVEAAVKLIENNYSSKLSLNELANCACTSIYHFARIFKKVTGYSPYEYLIKYRINKAKQLLISTEHTIDEISSLVGFESTCNFSRTFKILEDISPLKYRKREVLYS